eukprot:4956314-Amphidinium_carterae.1
MASSICQLPRMNTGHRLPGVDFTFHQSEVADGFLKSFLPCIQDLHMTAQRKQVEEANNAPMHTATTPLLLPK